MGTIKEEVYKARGRSNLKVETEEMLILYLLDKRDLYGYQITLHFKKLSKIKVILLV